MTWQLYGCPRCKGAINTVDGTCLNCGYRGETIDAATLPKHYLKKAAKHKGDPIAHGKRKRQIQSTSGIIQAGLPWRI